MAMMKDMTNVGPLKYDNELSELEVIEISLFLHQLLTNECTSSLTQAVQNSPLSCVCAACTCIEKRVLEWNRSTKRQQSVV